MTDRQLPNYRWIKFDLSLLDDPAFMRLPSSVKGIYILAYLVAGKSDAGGLLCNSHSVYGLDDMAYVLHLDAKELSEALEALKGACLLASDGEGYRIARFMEEQGPGDNEQRKSWRERQNQHRNRTRKEKEEEVEEEVEVDKRVTVTSPDVTVTPPEPPPPPSSAASFSLDEEIFQNYWRDYQGRKLSKKKTIEFFEVIKENLDEIPDWSSRLGECLMVWNYIVKKHTADGWSKNNPDAVMELYPLPALEDRMERERMGWDNAQKEVRRKEILEAWRQ
jgi:hypothetical protein